MSGTLHKNLSTFYCCQRHISSIKSLLCKHTQRHHCRFFHSKKFHLLLLNRQDSRGCVLAAVCRLRSTAHVTNNRWKPTVSFPLQHIQYFYIVDRDMHFNNTENTFLFLQGNSDYTNVPQSYVIRAFSIWILLWILPIILVFSSTKFPKLDLLPSSGLKILAHWNSL